VHPLGVAPEPLVVWYEELEGLVLQFLVEEILKKTSFEDMYPTAPEPMFEYL
jgi:hypothetical protein